VLFSVAARVLIPIARSLSAREFDLSLPGAFRGGRVSLLDAVKREGVAERDVKAALLPELGGLLEAVISGCLSRKFAHRELHALLRCAEVGNGQHVGRVTGAGNELRKGAGPRGIQRAINAGNTEFVQTLGQARTIGDCGRTDCRDERVTVWATGSDDHTDEEHSGSTESVELGGEHVLLSRRWRTAEVQRQAKFNVI
jgi:hypothetical protein